MVRICVRGRLYAKMPIDPIRVDRLSKWRAADQAKNKARFIGFNKISHENIKEVSEQLVRGPG